MITKSADKPMTTPKSYYDILMDHYAREESHKCPEISLAKVSIQFKEMLESDEWEDWPPMEE